MKKNSIPLGVVEAAEQAGVTYRQLDYWITTGLIEATGTSGSGNARTLSATDLPKIRALGDVSRAVRRGSEHSAVPFPLLGKVATHWSKGRADLGDGVTLVWKVRR